MTRAKTKRRGLHQIALAALFTVGNTLLRFPWKNTGAGISISFPVSAIAAVCAVALVYPAAGKLLRAPFRKRIPRMIAAGVFCAAVSAVSLFCAARCASDLLAFFGETLLPRGTEVPFSALFLAAAVCLARAPRRSTDGFALIVFFASCVAVAVLFLRGAPQFRAEYGAVDFSVFSGADVLSGTLWAEVLLPMAPLAVYFGVTTPRRKGKSVRSPVFGTLAGVGILLVCVLQTLLTFGAEYAAALSYPYSRAVRVVSVGQYAFRPEILSYLLDYSACLFRTAVCFASVRRLFGRFLPRAAKWVPALLGLGVFIYLYLR